jgi:hypothetical protein
MRRMSIGTDNSLVSTSKPFAPTDLFLGDDSIKGAVYDVSEQRGQLYTTSTGEELCGAPGLGSEVSVGMILDGRYGYSLGPELLDPDYTTWTTHASVSVVDGKFTLDGATSIPSNTTIATPPGSLTLTVGKQYLCTWRVDTVISSGIRQEAGDVRDVVTAAVGTYTTILTATGTTTYRIINRASTLTQTGQFSPLSCREIIGVPLVQPTSTKRPAWRARYNLLTYSEDMTNGVWLKSGLDALTPGAEVEGLTGYELTASTTGTLAFTYQNVSTSLAGIYVYYVKVRAGSVSSCSIAIRDVTAAAWIANTCVIVSGPGSVSAGVQPIISSLSTSEWTTIKLTTTTAWTAGNAMRQYFYVRQASSGSMVEGDSIVLHSEGVSYYTSANSTIPIYQYIADALTYDNSSAFPRYLQGDGVDDFMYSATNMDMSGTGVVSMVSGVTKLQDAATEAVWEHGTNPTTATGFNFLAPSSTSASYFLSALGTLRSQATYTTYTPPITNLVSAYFNSAHTDAVTAVQTYVDGVAVSPSAVINNVSTGSFDARVLYLMSRAGTSLFFDGFIYSQIIFGGTLSESNRKSCEQWIAQRMRLTI